MADPVRVMIQMYSTPVLATAAFGPVEAAPDVGMGALPGVQFDTAYAPVPIPAPSSAESAVAGMAAAFSARQPATYVVRASVHPDALEKFLAQAKQDTRVAGVFSDPRIAPIAAAPSAANCPSGPVGTDLDIERLLNVAELRQRGLDGTGVKVAIVDTGINLAYLRNRGKNPGFDPDLSWGPLPNQPLGNMPVQHGTMCAYDVCIAAPGCTLVDHAVLTSQTAGGSAMDGLLSDAVKSYGVLLSYLTKAPSPFAGDHTPRTLVVNNSWGMFQPSWDFPVGDPQNYSDNPNHPFNIIVASLEAAGADILFAAGNCGRECPDSRCGDHTNDGIFGANSSAAVTSVAGVTIDKVRIGYSTRGPGHLEAKKPDIASFTHFAGSGVFAADGGTSAATPVATGVVAAIRRLYPAGVLSPAQLRDLLRNTAEPKNGGFSNEYGYGVINVPALLAQLPGPAGSSVRGTARGASAAKGGRRQ